MADSEPSDSLPTSQRHRSAGTWAGFSRQAEKVSGWCRKCGLHLFRESNQWIRLSQEYVFHSAGDDLTSAIEESLNKAGEELTGSKELARCRIVLLRCKKCNDRIGLHCNRGTRTQRYKNMALVRTKKIVLKRAHDAPDLDFNIVGRVGSSSDDDVQSDEAAGEAAQSSQPPQPLPTTALPLRNGDIEASATKGIGSTPSAAPLKWAPAFTSTPAPVPAPTPASASASTPAVITLGSPIQDAAEMESSEVCRTCKVKHMKCNRRHPTCRSCAHMGRQCVWPPNAILTPIKHSSAASTPRLETAPTTPTGDLSASDCGACMKRHRKCDRLVPKCSSCASSRRICDYPPKKVNTIDLLDPGPIVVSSTSSLPLRTAEEVVDNGGGDDEEIKEEEDTNGGYAGDDAADSEDSEESEDGEDGDHGNTLLSTAKESQSLTMPEPLSQTAGLHAKELENVIKQMEEHSKLIEEQDSTIAKLNSTVLKQAGTIVELRSTVERMTDSIAKFEEWIEQAKSDKQNLLMSEAHDAREFSKSYETSVNNILSPEKEWKRDVVALDHAAQTKATHQPTAHPGETNRPPRNSAGGSARRGGHAANRSFGRNLASLLPRKRPLNEATSGELVLHSTSAPSPADNIMAVDKPGRSDSRAADAGTRNSSTSFHSLYDATPPPARPASGPDNAMQIDSNPQTVAGETQAVPATQSENQEASFQQLALVPATEPNAAANRDDESDESETQAYLQRTVIQEDPDDDDYEPGDESTEPYQWPAPDTQAVRDSVDRLLTPAHPVSTSPRRGLGRPRGRPPKHRALSGPNREYEWMSQDSFVPSTPSVSTGTTPVHGSAKRRGVGGVLKPVPADLSHSAFSSSQAATMIDDPTPKRAKVDDGPVSFATTPQHFGKVSAARYSEPKVRDAQGFLLNKDGSRDMRSMRGKLLGRHAFTRGDGTPRTVKAILQERGGGIFPASSPLAQPASPQTPMNAYAPTAVATSASPRFYDPPTSQSSQVPMTFGFSPINSPSRTNNVTPRLAQTSVPAAQTSTNTVGRTDVGDRAAMAEAERVAKQYDKGSNKEYSAKHMAIMSKMKL